MSHAPVTSIALYRFLPRWRADKGRVPLLPRRGHAICKPQALGESLFWRYAVLEGLKVAMLVADAFEQSEFVEPKQALEQAGAETVVVSPHSGEVQGFRHFDKGERFPVDVVVDKARAEDFAGLVLPGGVANPDQLRTNRSALNFVKAFFDQGKPVGVICHGPWTLIDAEVVRGRTITSWPSLKTDLKNAGANWVDREVVVDKNLISSRKPADLPAFIGKLVEMLANEGGRSKTGAKTGAQPRPGL